MYVSVHTHMCSRDLTQVARLVQQAPLHTQLTCYPSSHRVYTLQDLFFLPYFFFF